MRLGQSVRLASVRCLTLPSWRKDSRRRMQAGEFRLGTVSMYMSTNMPIIAVQINKKSIIYMATFSSLKSPDLSIEAIQRTIVRSNFSLTNGVVDELTALFCTNFSRPFEHEDDDEHE